ncbi:MULTISPECIES: hypothetical protein [Halorussus]|uniref:Uncharacterized protein n=2 Tax=Halorussus TaxID=1070314 RepID=A0A8U0HV65_9EURY|nr:MULTISPECIES: hypothetical protein [Halorussus]UPV74586.1 hypothetical protein M0R89_00610 [Halorussus limi]
MSYSSIALEDIVGILICYGVLAHMFLIMPPYNPIWVFAGLFLLTAPIFVPVFVILYIWEVVEELVLTDSLPRQATLDEF